MINTILFPSSFFDIQKVDEDLQKEYDAAVECGLYDQILLFSYEDWFHHGRLILDHSPAEETHAVYRGWMMKPEQYRQFYDQLMARNIVLSTTVETYERFHIFPNIYPAIQEDTPQILLFPEGTSVDLAAVKKAFSRFMVKDYVKSVKGTEFPVFFDERITQEAFDRWMERFYHYRGSLFTGGICIKEFVELKKYGTRKNEFRVFYINGQIATISRNSGQPDFVPMPPMPLIEKYRDLDSCLYTVDFAELSSGKWIVIEAGDGSVSGLSDYQDYREFFRKLYYCFL